MPKYQVTAPDGRQFELEGDSPPTQEKLDEIFAGLPSAPKPQTVQMGKVRSAPLNTERMGAAAVPLGMAALPFVLPEGAAAALATKTGGALAGAATSALSGHTDPRSLALAAAAGAGLPPALKLVGKMLPNGVPGLLAQAWNAMRGAAPAAAEMAPATGGFSGSLARLPITGAEEAAAVAAPAAAEAAPVAAQAPALGARIGVSYPSRLPSGAPPALAQRFAAEAPVVPVAAEAAPASKAAQLMAFGREAAKNGKLGAKIHVLLDESGAPVRVLTPDEAGAAARAGQPTTWIKNLWSKAS